MELNKNRKSAAIVAGVTVALMLFFTVTLYAWDGALILIGVTAGAGAGIADSLYNQGTTNKPK